MEKFEKGELVSKLLSKEIRWDSTTSKWKVKDYVIRNYEGEKQTIIAEEALILRLT